MEAAQIDIVTVVVAALLSFIIGFFWYSKWLFGLIWARHHKIKESDKHSKAPIVYEAIVSLVIACALAFFINYMGVVTVSDGMFVAFIAWLGFVATTQLSHTVWTKAPFQVFLIDASYRLLSFLVMGGIIAA